MAYYPELELDWDNLQPTCGASGPCHFYLAHLGDWSSYEPEPDAEAARRRARVRNRKKGRVA